MIRKFADRNFQFWEFKVSHGQLLIRSPKSSVGNLQYNIDIVFVDVAYVELPRFLPKMYMDVPSDLEVASAASRVERTVSAKDVFILVSNGRRYAVVAAHVKILENELDIFDNPY